MNSPFEKRQSPSAGSVGAPEQTNAAATAVMEPPATPTESQAAPAGVPRDRYFWAQFQAKTNKHDPDCVKIKVNGEGMIFSRMRPVIVPLRYLHAADNAQEQRFEMQPGKPMKKRAPVAKYPYQILVDRGNRGEVSEDVFLKTRAEMTQKRREFLANVAMAQNPGQN